MPGIVDDNPIQGRHREHRHRRALVRSTISSALAELRGGVVEMAQAMQTWRRSADIRVRLKSQGRGVRWAALRLADWSLVADVTARRAAQLPHQMRRRFK